MTEAASETLGGSRVVVLAFAMPPEGLAVARRWEFFATELAKAGAEVTVVCREHPRSDEPRPYRLVEVPGRTTSNTLGLAKRALGELVFAVRCASVLRKLPADVVVVSIPFVPLLLSRFGMRRGSSLVVEIRDLTWEYMPATKLGRAAGAVFRRIAAGGVRAATGVIATTEGQVDAARRLAGTRKTPWFSCIRNGADRSVVQAGEAEPSDELVVTYCGNLGLPQGLSSFVAAAELLPHWRFVLVGDGPDEERLRQVTERLGVDNVEFRGRVPASEVGKVYAEARALFAGLRSDPVYSVTIPSKIYECMAAGRPLVYGGAGEAAEIVTRSGGGIVVPPEAPAELAAALRELEDGERAAALAAAGRRYVEGEGSRDAGATKLKELLAGLRDAS